MNRVYKFFKNNYIMIFRLLFIFIFTFLVYYILGFYINSGDPTADYGFSHAILMGEVPYRDFNLISTPLYAFSLSIFLHISDEFLMFNLGQTVLVTIMFYFLFKMLDKRAYIVLISMIIFKFYGFLQTYNFMCFFMMIVILYLEKNKKNDYLIGFFLGLAFLSKQTIGFLYIIPTFVYYFKDLRKIFKRFIGFLIPNIILITYLIVNKAFFQFIDLCFLGLFDFGNNNGGGLYIWFLITIILFIIEIILFIKRRDNIYYFYLLLGIGFVIPIVDLNHFSLYFVTFSISIIPYINLSEKYLNILLIGLITEFTLFNFLMGIREHNIILVKDINHFKYTISYKINYEVTKKNMEFINKYKAKNFILLSYFSMNYDIIENNSINYFDVLLYGNYGYNGSLKMIKKISNMHNKYFIINMDEYSSCGPNSQFDEKIIKYTIENSKLVDKNSTYEIYYKE